MPTTANSSLRIDRRNVVSNILVLFAGSAISQGAVALVFILTARQLGVAAYGQYSSSLALAGITSILFNLGLDTWLIRSGGSDPRRLPRLTGAVFSLKLLMSLVWLALLALIYPFLDKGSFPPSLFAWTVLAVALDSFFLTSLATFKAALRNLINATLESFSDIAWLLFTLFLIYRGVYNPVVYVQVRVIVLAASLLAGLILVRYKSGIERAPLLMRTAARETLPFAGSDFLAIVSMRVDLLIVAVALGSIAAGLYSPALSVTNALFFIPGAIYTVMLPTLSNLYARSVQQAGRTIRMMLLLLAGLGIAMAVGFAWFAPFLVRFLSTGYQDSLPIMRILGLILLLKPLTFGMATVIVAAGRQSARFRWQVVVVVVYIVLDLLVVLPAGIAGVAWVYVFAEVLTLTGYTILAYRAHQWLKSNQSSDPAPLPEIEKFAH
jgi:O-antigen/teichoic acid export membrane protein